YLNEKDRFIYNDLIRRAGAVVFSSSKGGEFSYESDSIENGFFTEAIMKAITGSKADKNKDKLISIDELKDFVSRDVPKQTKKQQHPTVDKDNIFQNFTFPGL
ncbi:hypothetical protein KAH94_03045, partial [bacterium]|nr:hypothetical protein [bacterium]